MLYVTNSLLLWTLQGQIKTSQFIYAVTVKVDKKNPSQRDNWQFRPS